MHARVKSEINQHRQPTHTGEKPDSVLIYIYIHREKNAECIGSTEGKKTIS